MQQFKFNKGVKVKHDKMVGAGEVLEQVNSDLTAVRWYNKSKGFYKTLCLTSNLYKLEEANNE